MTEGYKKALELIAENKRTKIPFLDLGNLGLTEVPEEVFVSYSHKDMEYKDELVTALAYLERMEEIELWQDGRIMAGKEWNREIFEKLAAADIVICLISSNFIDSDFCYSVELKEALEAHEKGQKIIVPIQIKKSG